MSKKAIEVYDLVKNYGAVRAVRGISFSVEEGALFSFLGENGAGKSTTINILCSVLQKDGGTVRVCGYDLDTQADRIKACTGVVFQGSVLDDLLTVRENLTVRASYYGLKGAEWKQRLAELTDLLSLQDILNRPYGKLSGGQKRRADIARGLLNQPKLLILDEPTTGLDPQTRKSVWEIVLRLRKERGMTVFLTTHYMEEADGADDVVILNGGTIAAHGTPAQLKNLYSRTSLCLYGEPSRLRNALSQQGIACEEIGGGVRVRMQDFEQIRAFLAANPELCRDFEVIKGSMDDVFLTVTGRSAEEEQ